MVTRGRKVCGVCFLIISRLNTVRKIQQMLADVMLLKMGQVSCAPTAVTLPISVLKTASLTHYYWKKLYFWKNSLQKVTEFQKSNYMKIYIAIFFVH